MKEKRKLSRQNIYNVILVELIIIIIVCVFCLIRYYIQTEKEEETFEQLKNMVVQSQDGVENEETKMYVQVEEKTLLRDFEQLYKTNSDFVGWITINGTRIDYPVMQSGDNQFYLNHNFAKEKSKAGVIFADARADLENDKNNVIIYGHNMRAGTMFADLLQYAEKDFYEEHTTFQFDSIYQKGTYEIVSAFYTQVYPDDDTEHFNFYNYVDLSDEEVFKEFKSNVEALSLYQGAEIEATDSLITLVTCSYHSSDDERFVVVAKKIK